MGEKSGFEDDIPHEEIKDTDIPKYSDELEKDKREKMERELKDMEKQMRWTDYRGSVFVLIFGVIFFAVGCVLCFERLSNKKRCTKFVHGEVIGFTLYESHRQEDEKEKPSYAPVFRYYYDDHEYTQEGKAYSGKDNLFVGKKLDIYVDPYNPSNIYVPDYNVEKKADIMLVIVGAILIFVGEIYPKYRFKKDMEALRREYESRL